MNELPPQPERIPFPDRIVRLVDIAKGVGSLVLDLVQHSVWQVRHEPPDYASNHYRFHPDYGDPADFDDYDPGAA